MLDPWIIEEIRRREEEERQQGEQRPMLEIPMDAPRRPLPRERDGMGEGFGSPAGSPLGVPEEERGVVIVDFTV